MTDEKILELIGKILSNITVQYSAVDGWENYVIPKKISIPIIRNWLEENKIVDHQEWLRHEKDRHDAEEYECAMMLLDKLNVPKIDSVNNETYSLAGRIKNIRRCNMPDEHEEIIRRLEYKLQIVIAYVTLGIEPGYSLNEQQLNVGKALMKHYMVDDIIRNIVLPKLAELPTNKEDNNDNR